MDHGVIHKLPNHMYPELMELVYIIRSPDGKAPSSVCDAYVARAMASIITTRTDHTLMEIKGFDRRSVRALRKAIRRIAINPIGNVS